MLAVDFFQHGDTEDTENDSPCPPQLNFEITSLCEDFMRPSHRVGLCILQGLFNFFNILH